MSGKFVDFKRKNYLTFLESCLELPRASRLGRGILAERTRGDSREIVVIQDAAPVQHPGAAFGLAADGGLQSKRRPVGANRLRRKQPPPRARRRRKTAQGRARDARECYVRHVR